MKKTIEIEIKIYTGSSDKCVLCRKNIISGSKYIELEEDLAEEGRVLYNKGIYHFYCIAIRKYFIAYIDVLGFEKFTLESPLEQVYRRIENLFTIAKASRVEGSIANESRVLAEIPYLVISDGIILYKEVITNVDKGNELDWKEGAFSEFLLSLEELYKKAFRMNIQLRGGISFGECLIFPSRIHSYSQEHIIIGKPYIEAYKIERVQSWMGVAFHPSMTNYLNESRHNEMLTRYKIPIKRISRRFNIPNFTISWVDASMSNEREKFDQWNTENNRERKIKSNTIKFFDKFIHRPSRLLGIGSIEFTPVA